MIAYVHLYKIKKTRAHLKILEKKLHIRAKVKHTGIRRGVWVTRSSVKTFNWQRTHSISFNSLHTHTHTNTYTNVDCRLAHKHIRVWASLCYYVSCKLFPTHNCRHWGVYVTASARRAGCLLINDNDRTTGTLCTWNSFLLKLISADDERGERASERWPQQHSFQWELKWKWKSALLSIQSGVPLGSAR